MNLRANGARNYRRNEEFMSLLQHKTRVRHFWTSKSEKLTWNILLYVGKPLFCIDSSLRFYFLSGYGVMSSTTPDNKRDYNVWALRNSFLTKESFWCFYIAFKDIEYTSKHDSLVLTTILSFLCQYFERNGKQAWKANWPLAVSDFYSCHDNHGTVTNCCNDATIMIHSIYATMTNHLTQYIYDEPFHSFHPWRAISSLL